MTKRQKCMGKGYSKDGTDSKQTGGIDPKTRSRWRNLRTYQPAKLPENDPKRGEWISVAKAVHNPPKTRKMTNCPVCRVSVRTDRLEKHIRKVHPDYSESSNVEGPEMEAVLAETSAQFVEEALSPSDYESRFGDKYIAP